MYMKKADIVFHGGQIYTMNKKEPQAQSVAVRDGKIIAVGSNGEIESYIDEKTKVIPLEGKFMLPGFIDAHAHPILAAFFSSGIAFDVYMTLEDIINGVATYIEENPEKEAYVGAGYPEWIFSAGGPKKEILDEICKEKPILLIGSGGHEAWSNSKGFEIAGVDADFPDPIPNFHYFHRDKEGQPTGGIVETGPVEFMMKALNPFDRETIKQRIRDNVGYFNSLGITTIVDCGSFDFMEEVGLPLLKEMREQNLLNYRLFGCTFVARKDQVRESMEKLKKASSVYNDDFFSIQFLKIINDGTVESRSASFFEPYGDSDTMSAPLLEGEELYGLCMEAAKEGFDIYIHAIGDRSIHETLMAAKRVREAGYENIRITNAHTQYVKKEERPLFGKYNVIANTTGSWHYGNTDLDEALLERKDEIFTMKELLNYGAKMSLGSDFPVDELGPEPLKAIEIATTRQMFGERDSMMLNPLSERLTIHEAIEGYTTSAAYQVHMEDKIGTIAVGKYADLAIFEENPFEVDPYAIHKIPVVMTVFNGKIVYDLKEEGMCGNE